MREPFTSIETAASHADALLAQGRYEEAAASYRDLVRQTHVIDFEYDDWLRRLAEVYEHLGRTLEAGTIYMYLHYFDLARAAFSGDDGLAERARVASLEKNWGHAAGLYAEAGMPVHAAVALEKAGSVESAAKAWGALLKDTRLRDRNYELALGHFNHGMALEESEGPGAGSRALIESQRLLEQVADDFEISGERERAFDCYHILLKLGRDSGQFENLAEGYLNCIRVLKDDNLKFYVLQYYEEFASLAQERKELYAAATLYQEAADFSMRSGLPYDQHYQVRAAECWVACGEKYLGEGTPLELVENAFLAAVAGYSSVGNYAEVEALFLRMTELDFADKRKARYARLAEDYQGATSEPIEGPELPEYLRQHYYADIWFVDLLEWELAGDPRQVALSLIGDLRYPNPIRRRALAVALTLGDGAHQGQANSPETLANVAELLGELQSYPALKPLEVLFEHPVVGVREAAVKALRFLFFKRSFVILRQALRDGEPRVVTAAVEALRSLHFPHAFNPLARIFSESDDMRVRAVALEAIGKIESIEAAEFLLSVLRQETGELREVASRALQTLDNPDVLPILRQHQEIETQPEVRDVLASLQSR